MSTMLRENVPYPRVPETIRLYPGPLPRDPVHLEFTRDMIRKYGAIHSIGHWNPVTEEPGSSDGFGLLRCPRLIEGILHCEEMTIDVKTGLIDGEPRLGRTVFVVDGHVAQELPYPHATDRYLEVLMGNREILGVYLMDGSVYRSNFNQMYLLGHHDPRLFEEAYNAFPAARVYRFRQRAEPLPAGPSAGTRPGREPGPVAVTTPETRRPLP